MMSAPGPWLAGISLFFLIFGTLGGRILIVVMMLLGYCLLRLGDRLPVIIYMRRTGDVTAPQTQKMWIIRWISAVLLLGSYLVFMVYLVKSTGPKTRVGIGVLWSLALVVGILDTICHRIWTNEVVDKELGW